MHKCRSISPLLPARISHHGVPLLAEKASSVWGCRLHCFCEAVAHCFVTYRIGEKCGLVMLCAAAGCGSGRLPTAPVEGKVLYNGEPLRFGSVMFQPDSGPIARGAINSDGTFELSTYTRGDGAVIGKHRVRIACFEDQGPEADTPDLSGEPGIGKPLIPRKYTRSSTSGLSVEVKQSNEPLVFELSD